MKAEAIIGKFSQVRLDRALPPEVSIQDVGISPRPLKPGDRPPTLATSNAKQKKDWDGSKHVEVDLSSLDDVKAAIWKKVPADEALKKYAEGKEAPPIKVGYNRDGTREIIDGMHRLSTARILGIQRINVIFIR